MADVCATAAAAVEPAWVTLPGVMSGEMDGDRVASGEREGLKEGDMAGEVNEDSWLIGERGSEGIGI